MLLKMYLYFHLSLKTNFNSSFQSAPSSNGITSIKLEIQVEPNQNSNNIIEENGTQLFVIVSQNIKTEDANKIKLEQNESNSNDISAT